ncbi:MAG: response regulator [Pseudolabrys sp.]|nr:response regulator [Pseudolabrys sp.]MDP2293848.1 response regulator [Pseudolabrys sp.]
MLVRGAARPPGRKANTLQHSPTSELYVVESDSRMRDSLSSAFALAGYHVVAFAEAKTFIAAARMRTPAGVVLDFHLPDRSGLVVLDELDAKQYPAPILMTSANSNIACAIKAVKNGAFDYLVKPFDVAGVVASVAKAIQDFGKVRGHSEGRHARLEFNGSELLTSRERTVLTEIAGGSTNKETARRLCISTRTVEAHRARAMEKIGAKNAMHMMRIILGADASPI